MIPGLYCIVRAYNEERALGATLDGLMRRGYQAVVVDDGSRDGTAEVAARYPVYLVRHAINLGPGAALQTGMSYALSRGAKWFVHFDADGQHDPDEINGLVDPLLRDEADVVLGSRFLRSGDAGGIPFTRRLVLRGGVLVNWLLTGVKLTDAHNGFRALNRRAAEAINLDEESFAYASELVEQIRRHRLRFVEHPTRITYTDYSRAKGQSSWNAVNIVLDFLAARILK